MASVQQVSFAAPSYDYGADLAQIERRRAMAQALQQQSMQPIEQAPVGPGQFATPISPFQGAAKMLQAYAANRQQSRADMQQRQLAEKTRKDLADVLMRGQKAMMGTPATPLSEDASGNVTPAQPAAPGSMSSAASIYMQHPQLAGIGAGMLQQDAQQRMRQEALASILNPKPSTPNATPQPSYGSTGFKPEGASSGASPNPLAGIPPQVVGLLTSGDPELQKLGTTIMEANKGVAQRPGAPVVNPFTGAVIAQAPPSVPQGMQITGGGPQGFTASVVPGFSGAQEQIRSIPDPSHGLIPIKTSSGQDIQLTQPEYLQWQKNGQLPQRLGGPAPALQTGQGGIPNFSQQRPSAANQAGFSVPGAPGLGIIGAGQTQAEQNLQASQHSSNTEAGKEFISEMRQNYAKLRDVPATIDNINRAKGLAAGSAGQFMGPLGESKLALQKFFRSNVPGMGGLNVEGVTSAEELQSSLFNQVMDNLKKMDASPSQYQQQVMQEAFGTLRTDPSSLPKILDVFEDILRKRVDLHNETAKSAAQRGTNFPYDVTVKLPNKVRSFTNEAEASKAGLKKGDRVIINGVSGTWQ